MKEATKRTSGRVPRVPLHDGCGRQFQPVTEPATAPCTFRDLHGPLAESLIGGWAAWRNLRTRQARKLETKSRTTLLAETFVGNDQTSQERNVSFWKKGPSEIKEGLLLSEVRLDFGLSIGGTRAHPTSIDARHCWSRHQQWHPRNGT